MRLPQAAHWQRTGECVGAAFLTVLCCLIFKDHNHVHGAVPVELKGIVSTLRRGQSAGLSGYPTSEGDYDFSICGLILPLLAAFWIVLTEFFAEVFLQRFFGSADTPLA